MSGVAGIELKSAFKKAATWGTAVACGANNGILCLPGTLKKDFPIDVDDSLGNFWIKDGLLGEIKVEGSRPAYLRYDSLDLLIAMFMGTAGTPSLHTGGAASYDYIYKWASDLSGKFVTIADNMKNYIREIPSAKVVGMTIKGEIGKSLQIIFDFVGINKVVDSVVNTTGTFSNVTFREIANRIKFSEGIFRMNTQSGAALATGDKIYPTSFELTAKRKMSGVYDHQNVYTSGSNKQDLIDEPQNDGMPEIKLKMEFPRHTGTTYLALIQADTRQKMDMTFTGGIIEGAIARSFLIQLPHLQLINDDPTDEAGRIKEPLEFNVYGASAAPTGMTGITDPFWISGINQLSTDPLA